MDCKRQLSKQNTCLYARPGGNRMQGDYHIQYPSNLDWKRSSGQLESWDGLFLIVTDVLTTCAEASAQIVETYVNTPGFQTFFLSTLQTLLDASISPPLLIFAKVRDYTGSLKNSFAFFSICILIGCQGLSHLESTAPSS